MTTTNTEIRKLGLDVKEHLSNILNQDSSWKRLAEKITRPDGDTTLLYRQQDIQTIERFRDSPANVLLSDWGTHGRHKRPTVDDLIDLLCKCNLFRAADYLAVDVLHGEPVSKNCLSTTELLAGQSTSSSSVSSRHFQCDNFGDKNVINFAPNLHCADVKNSESFMDTFDSANLSAVINRSLTLPHVDFEKLRFATDNFNDRSWIEEGGRMLGKGAFGTVYLAKLDNGESIAIKKLDFSVEAQFQTELIVSSRLQHRNVLRLLAYSANTSTRCLIYEYMVNGSLQDRLARLHGTPHLLSYTRLKIAIGLAEGLVALHVSGYVHRDVKSANVLLDHDMTPKLGDFGIVHESPPVGCTSMLTKNIMGTSVYMPKEALYGDITVKFDSYSFGVVLLELLTGRKPFDYNTRIDLITQVGDQCKSEDQVPEILDPYSGWKVDVAKELYKISQKCLENNKGNRPKMSEVLDMLLRIVQQFDVQQH